jgi:CheY-like chemotaxis protein
MMHDRQARVLLVDDHALMRVAMRATLGHDDALVVVGEAKDGLEAEARCRQLEPDLVLMDVSMPVLDGIEATRRIKTEFPETSVLILTAHAEQGMLMDAVKAGAAGYVLKEDYPRSHSRLGKGGPRGGYAPRSRPRDGALEAPRRRNPGAYRRRRGRRSSFAQQPPNAQRNRGPRSARLR